MLYRMKMEHHHEAENTLWDEKVKEGKFQGWIVLESNSARESQSQAFTNSNRISSSQERDKFVLNMRCEQY